MPGYDLEHYHNNIFPLKVLGIYATSKTAMLGLTKAMATQLAKSNIRVNCVAPGLIKTKMSKAVSST